MSENNASDTGGESGFREQKATRRRSRENEKLPIRIQRGKQTEVVQPAANSSRPPVVPRPTKTKRVEGLEQQIRLLTLSLNKEVDLKDREALDEFKNNLKDFESNLSLAKDDPESFFNSLIGKYLSAIKDIIEKFETEHGVELGNVKEVVEAAIAVSTKILTDYVASRHQFFDEKKILEQFNLKEDDKPALHFENLLKSNGKSEDFPANSGSAGIPASPPPAKPRKEPESPEMLEEKLPDSDSVKNESANPKGRGTTRSGRPIAGPGNKSASTRTAKVVPKASEIAEKTPKRIKNLSPDIEKKAFKEDELDSALKQSAGPKPDTNRELRQTAKKVIKKISKEISNIYGQEADTATAIAAGLEQKVKDGIAAEVGSRNDTSEFLKNYKAKIVELIKAIQVSEHYKAKIPRLRIHQR